MNTFEVAARATLNGWFAPAMTLAELLSALERDHPQLHRMDGVTALRTLERADGIRVLRRPPSAEAAELGPVAWVLCYRPDRTRSEDPCLASRRLRESVITLGRITDTEALTSWARWNHMAIGAAKACALLSRGTGRERTTGRRWSDPRSPAVRVT